MEILTLKQLESQKIQTISQKFILIRQKKFSLGPIFAKHCSNAMLNFCRIVQAESVVIDHTFYFSIWLHYPVKVKQKTESLLPKESSPSSKNKIDEPSILPSMEAAHNLPTINSDFIQCCQTTLINLVGPIGKLIIQKALGSSNIHTPLSLIETITDAIPDPEKAEQFRTQFIPTTPQ